MGANSYSQALNIPHHTLTLPTTVTLGTYANTTPLIPTPLLPPQGMAYCRTLIPGVAWFYSKILYFSVDGTWFSTTRPSYDSDAKTHASDALHASEYTLSSCSSNVRT